MRKVVTRARSAADIPEHELWLHDIEYPRDPDDVPVLATLIASGADILVTGDRDLLAPRGKYPIETPAEFVRRL